MQNKETRKVVWLHEVENFNNSNICMIAINLKDCFEKFKGRKIN